MAIAVFGADQDVKVRASLGSMCCVLGKSKLLYSDNASLHPGV